MKTPKNQTISNFFKSLGYIIKKTINHKNGDTTIRYGKGGVMKKSIAPQWFQEFQKENDKRWEENNKRWEENNKRWDQQFEFNKMILQEIKLIKSCPTIQRELAIKE